MDDITLFLDHYVIYDIKNNRFILNINKNIKNLIYLVAYLNGVELFLLSPVKIPVES